MFICFTVVCYYAPLQVYHRRRNKCEKVQPFIEGHNKPVKAKFITTNVVSLSSSLVLTQTIHFRCTIDGLRRIRDITSAKQLSHPFRKGRTRSGKHQHFLLQKVMKIVVCVVIQLTWIYNVT